jgi:hypothetical protein
LHIRTIGSPPSGGGGGETGGVRVVAIGGSASVGKSTCAEQVADLLGLAEVLHVDDLSKRLQRGGRPHVLDTIEQPWSQPAKYLVEQLVAWTAELHPLILDGIDRLARTGGVIEGEGVDPRLAGDFARAGVSSVYLFESDRASLRATFCSRPSSPTFLTLSKTEQDAVVEMNYLYGDWLRRAATDAGQPCVPSRPWGSLASRILQALD